MKNAMKKLMAFALVAVMLVSAVPTAFAEEAPAPAATNFSVKVMFTGKVNGDVDITAVPGDTINTVYIRAANQKGINTSVFAASKFIWNGAVTTNQEFPGTEPIGESGLLTVEMGVSSSHVHNGNWDAGRVVTAATCKDTGEMLYTCACGLTTTETIPVNSNHSWVDATCTTPKTCSVCNTTEGSSLGHTSAAATCTTPQKCTRCGVNTGSSDLADHTPNVDNATCQVAKFCTVCKTELEAIKDHTPNIPNATCTQAKICEDCDTQLEAALGHTPNAEGKCTRCNETVGTRYLIRFYPNYNTNNTPETVGIYEGGYIYGAYTPSRYGYTFGGWYYDSDLTQKVPSTATASRDMSLYAKWNQVAPKEVYVRVYINGNTNNVYAIVDLYEWAQDHVITKDDIEAAIAKHGLKAYNKAGLSVYGPFTPAQWNSYCLDDYYRNPTEKVNVEQNEKTVIYAMVHNVDTYVGSSSSGHKADSSNPKTGDMIFAPMMVLGASASALAALYYISKKRAY